MLARSEIQFPPVVGELTQVAGIAEATADNGLDAVRLLVRDAQRGDIEAFGELLGHFQDRVFRFVMRMLRNAHDAEDVTQDTFVKAWKHLGGFRTESNFSTWLYTIARRTALNHLRAQKPTQEITDHHEPVADGPDHELADRERADSIWAIARRLKPDQYEVLWLRYGEGFSVDETARIMNTNSIRVRVLLHRARKRMAEWLQPKSPNAGGSR